MGLLVWLIIGVLIGWITTLLRKNDKNTLKLECILTSMTGAVIGGLLINVFYGPGGIHISFSWQTTIAAVIGAVMVLFFYFLFHRKYNP